MQYPVRSQKNGKIILSKGDFGIKRSKYLLALLEFLKGSSIEYTSIVVSRTTGENVSKTMIKETFRVNLFRELARFAGDANRISFSEFCEENSIPLTIVKSRNARLDQQKIILFTVYLREVFDLKPPLEIKK